VIQHHPNRSGSDLRGEFVRRLAHNSSILFGSWSLRQTRRGSPRFGGQPIGVIHLVAEKMRERYLRHGLLYDGSDYLSLEEVPENLLAAFLAGRRCPIIGAPPEA